MPNRLAMICFGMMIAGGVIVAQRGPGGPPPPPPAQPTGGPPNANPLPGLTNDQQRLFRDGLREFLHIEDIGDGLGPAYNGTSCAGCHSLPSIGGFGQGAVHRAGTLQGGVFTEPQGGSLVHLFSIPNYQCQPRVPANANVQAHRIPTPIFGAGLVEAIPDETIRALENRPNPDGIRGRAAIVLDPATHTSRVGRYGWKAQQATLLAFAGDAYRNEMGITNELFPDEVGTGLSAQQLAQCDAVAGIEDRLDPVTHLRGIDQFENFMRFLGGPGRGQVTDSARRGSDVFDAIGCATCHVPVLTTGPNAVEALDRKPVAAFSDFLLHDIGTGDGIAQGAAAPNEFRTSPLWGMRARKQLMHDGRALSPAESIQMHRRESDQSRIRFENLPPQDRQALLDYLATL